MSAPNSNPKEPKEPKEPKDVPIVVKPLPKIKVKSSSSSGSKKKITKRIKKKVKKVNRRAIERRIIGQIDKDLSKKVNRKEVFNVLAKDIETNKRNKQSKVQEVVPEGGTPEEEGREETDQYEELIDDFGEVALESSAKLTTEGPKQTSVDSIGANMAPEGVVWKTQSFDVAGLKTEKTMKTMKTTKNKTTKTMKENSRPARAVKVMKSGQKRMPSAIQPEPEVNPKLLDTTPLEEKMKTNAMKTNRGRHYLSDVKKSAT